ncbi:MAG TPA: hypothetical protein DCS05_06455 [Nitrospiraceae bacterium]|nr:hypothetical protein [Nitrospiraceae bacterium]
MADKKWSLINPPPAGHKDVAKWAWGLFENSRDEKDRIKLPDTWKRNYSLYRGDHWGQKKKKNTISVNLFFSNVQRTVANITSRKPIAECIDLDGIGDGADKTLTAMLRKWWEDSAQQPKLRTTTLKSEKYGITTEKAYWDAQKKQPGIIVLDPFACFPAPGYYEDIGADMPYFCHAYPDSCEALEAKYGVEDVKPSEVYSILGEDREEYAPTVRAGDYTVQGKVVLNTLDKAGTEYRDNRALAVEVWVRDPTKVKIWETKEIGKDAEGKPIMGEVEVEKLKYPGGIRVITVTNEGQLLLADLANPSINLELNEELVKTCYLFDRLPFYKANSYDDTTSIWGFSAADQTADLIFKIDEIVSRIIKYFMRSMTGILVIPPKSGITKDNLSSEPGLVLFPATAEAAAGIRVVPMPSMNGQMFQVLDMLMGLFDRVYAIQDADRGANPPGVRAASAIVALQERNQVLIQHKINAIDYMVSQRGSCAISMWQNHGHDAGLVDVEGEAVPFRGVEYLGRKFAYMVEAGSTIHKTELQRQEQAVELFGKNAIDQQALLETLNFPGHKQIIERMGEKQLEQAIQILIQAGFPEDQAQELLAVLMQPQGGPGNGPQDSPISAQPKPGVPVAYQGETEQ